MSSIRTILVTGANQGLGMHTVHQLAASLNVLVFMGSRKLAAAQEALATFAASIHPSSQVVPVQLDITDPVSVKNAHTSIADCLREKNLPGLDVLINNAGRGGAIEEAYAVNVFGTVAMTEAMRPLLNNGSAILNISSRLGSLASYTKRPPTRIINPAYSSSKVALNSLTLQWAIQEEQKGSGIRVVSICPGYNATNLTKYSGGMRPAQGCKIIVREALAKEGRSGVYFDKDGDIEW
ncbi:short-chain dehydrogenase/reductase SDR [Mycena belliarum]|uniref:Short-chain dehydrogenase/reductase SDR n=1 Tax=Mycena belliarum TaxID=1033014 RepID=A0AAD6XQ18_9AGAR|nr:short-chain dehydrogenase/reductase SDR [Mycena belliae]